jgi:AcrR family transcriptional regulator
MPSKTETAVRSSRTFIEEARRTQIVAAAIDTIASVGFGQASIARIAERAGTSKGVITYHFADKEDLVRAIIADVLSTAAAYMEPRITAESTGRGLLRAYVASNLEFMRENRDRLITIFEIFTNARGKDGRPLLDATSLEGSVRALEIMLEQLQETGEFRAFDARAMALAIRAAIDIVPQRLVLDPTFDVDRYGAEIAETFDRATRGEQTDAAPGRPGQ